MHFVKKYPSTAEQKAKKKIEMAANLKFYVTVRDKIFEKRKNNQFDKEMLVLTASALAKNPEIYTFWNIRRKGIDILLKESEQKNEEPSDRESLIRAELLLTETCLEKNCKSYSAWFHRFWCFKQLKKPDVDKELALCEKFLSMDCRNFHCWDYRRQIVHFFDMPYRAELEFSTRLIDSNFSNYSSWYYRSYLLPILFPDPENQFIVEKQALECEYRVKFFDRLENAIFVDPEDHSAWMFIEWLFFSPKISCPLKNICVLGFICDVCQGNCESIITITFSHALFAKHVSNFLLIILEGDVQWDPSTCDAVQHLGTISYSLSHAFKITSAIKECNLRRSLMDPFKMINIEQPYFNKSRLYNIYEIECEELSEPRKQIIKKLMRICEVLIEELEIDDKNELMRWPVLTYTLALMKLNPIEMCDTILANLNKLAVEIDPQRSGMYLEIASDIQVNKRLREKINGVRAIDLLFAQVLQTGKGLLKMDNLGLKRSNHLQYLTSFITHLDVTGNQFADLREFRKFWRLTHLKLHKNPINSSEEISLPQLSYLGTDTESVVGSSNEVKPDWEKFETHNGVEDCPDIFDECPDLLI
ncbi:unnamed protein product [Thelazia callipaeda]|uniref:Geranylgeranyl transferase type-2 subunit alpha n=1 Tax=Thelazia callipaeda TaxID=103827 RepID=A0A0N5CXV0_THECL|nr:unnamed protein product [Thelazia callipaeda]